MITACYRDIGEAWDSIRGLAEHSWRSLAEGTELLPQTTKSG